MNRFWLVGTLTAKGRPTAANPKGGSDRVFVPVVIESERSIREPYARKLIEVFDVAFYTRSGQAQVEDAQVGDYVQVDGVISGIAYMAKGRPRTFTKLHGFALEVVIKNYNPTMLGEKARQARAEEAAADG